MARWQLLSSGYAPRNSSVRKQRRGPSRVRPGHRSVRFDSIIAATASATAWRSGAGQEVLPERSPRGRGSRSRRGGCARAGDGQGPAAVPTVTLSRHPSARPGAGPFRRGGRASGFGPDPTGPGAPMMVVGWRWPMVASPMPSGPTRLHAVMHDRGFDRMRVAPRDRSFRPGPWVNTAPTGVFFVVSLGAGRSDTAPRGPAPRKPQPWPFQTPRSAARLTAPVPAAVR